MKRPCAAISGASSAGSPRRFRSPRICSPPITARSTADADPCPRRADRRARLFHLPLDMLPDVLPIIGLTDDAAVLAGAIKLVWDNIRPEHRDAARRRWSG